MGREVITAGNEIINIGELLPNNTTEIGLENDEGSFFITIDEEDARNIIEGLKEEFGIEGC